MSYIDTIAKGKIQIERDYSKKEESWKGFQGSFTKEARIWSWSNSVNAGEEAGSAPPI